MSKALARQEGIFVGVSAGGTLAAAVEVAKTAPKGANIVAMLPDTGERYLSTPLFADIGEDMNDEEIALSTSTPGYRFDVSAPAPAAPAAAPAAIDADAETFVESVINDEPVVMFALEWCEFCWALRKLLAALGVEYRSIDIDSVEYQENDRGVKIRQALTERIGSPTIPQVFVAGEHLGGCTDVVEAFEAGALIEMFEKAGVSYDTDASVDAWSLLPQWVHPRKSA